MILTFACAVFSASAQKTIEGFDFSFKPTTYPPRYYVETEKTNNGWHRQAWYLPEKSMALDGWYQDEKCMLPNGIVKWYHPNRMLQSTGSYTNGKKEGTWLEFDEQGRLNDSATYVAGRLKGVRLHWYGDGMISDSSNFDGNGNGVEATFYEDGKPASAGRWVADTAKHGPWVYYDAMGKVLAKENYANGNKLSCSCFDENGNQLDSLACTENEAFFSKDKDAWRNFLVRTLNPDAPAKNGAPPGQYTVVAQFIVNKDGSLIDIKTLTNYGYGMEAEVKRMLRKSPKWEPAHQFGRLVKAYRKQPITFIVPEK